MFFGRRVLALFAALASVGASGISDACSDLGCRHETKRDTFEGKLGTQLLQFKTRELGKSGENATVKNLEAKMEQLLRNIAPAFAGRGGELHAGPSDAVEQTDSKDSSLLRQNSEALLMKMMQEEPASVAELNQAIENIFVEVRADHGTDQANIKLRGEKFTTCSQMPDANGDASTAADEAESLVTAKEDALQTLASGSITYNFAATGETEAAADDEETRIKTHVSNLKETYLGALNEHTVAQSGYDTFKKASDDASGETKAAKNKCLCDAKFEYDRVVEAAQQADSLRKANMKHFEMIKCVMGKFANKVVEEQAFKACLLETDTYVSDLDALILYREHAALADGENCKTCFQYSYWDSIRNFMYDDQLESYKACPEKCREYDECKIWYARFEDPLWHCELYKEVYKEDLRVFPPFKIGVPCGDKDEAEEQLAECDTTFWWTGSRDECQDEAEA